MKVRTHGFCLLTLFLLSLGATVQQSAHAADTEGELARGADIFRTNCASCHGPDGGPDPDSALVQSLGVVPANFADALIWDFADGGFFEGR